MAISFTLKFIEVIIIIICVCYYFAMAFKILCEIQNELFGWDNFNEEGLDEPEHFTNFYGISPEGRWGMDAMIILCYFSFTSLTTVGFGDYNPRSNWERIFIAFGLLMGVAIFSIIMGIFMDIIDQYKAYKSSNDQGDDLSRFFGTLKHFNGNEDIDLNFKREVERYFDHKWEVDKNFVINAEEYAGFF
jgi:uncharacterized membrane protein YagU involved in acid resistance